MERWRWLSPRPLDGRRLVTVTMLLRLVNALQKVCLSAFEATLFRAAFSLAFFRAFQMSELEARSRDDISGRMLAVSNISIKRSELHIQLRRSKINLLA